MAGKAGRPAEHRHQPHDAKDPRPRPLSAPQPCAGGAASGHGHAASDIIHITDYVVERGSDKHIAYAASKAALDNMTRSFARKLAPEVKVNAIAPSLIMFNEGDDEAYRQQALDKSLMKIAPGEKEISDLIDYLFTSRYVTGRSFAVDGGRPLRLVETAPAED